MGGGVVVIPPAPALPDDVRMAVFEWLVDVASAYEAEARAYAAIGCREHAPAADVVRDVACELVTPSSVTPTDP